MSIHQDLIDKFIKVTAIFIENEKLPNTYGSDVLLYMSEVHFIEEISRHSDLKVTELAQSMGLTKGRITHLTKQLKKKGMVESYKMEGNKKEVYLRLTEEGQKVQIYHEKHDKELIAPILNHLKTLTSDELALLDSVFNVIINSIK